MGWRGRWLCGGVVEVRAARCETCACWGRERAHEPERPYGTCRAGIPIVRKNTFQFPGGLAVPRGVWPWTAFDDWCVSGYRPLSVLRKDPE